ncbi:hypothetical protein [Pelagicoccus sp. SDUM812003]|uniref:hypothetical protein n=1 Tax=Pelagicoccus sp. SDUM812003 TaxID=3041267 RepID=UPI00280E2989|nr:hypothetical protein [Pelagicoccus sp. SDUM812003]MDQ8202041.1 hypothetical protein [Pelagicoccus sp. SDUM812003]
MKNLKKLLAGIAGVATATAAFGGANESASLSATIDAGALEIVASSLSGTYSPVGGAVTITGAEQADALVFNIDGITVDDLDGNGSGWVLSATPAANLTDGSNNLPLGTTAGFNNPSDSGNTTIDSANQITYGSGTGIEGYTVDYDVAYTVPAYTDAGSYTGVVAFAITSL